MRKLVALATVLGAALAPLGARGGAQEYEPLSASVQTALSRAISDKGVPQLEFADPGDGYRWLLAMSDRLAKRVPDEKSRVELLKTVHYEATRAGLDPQLVLGVVHVESGFKKYAVSKAGARGLMQVMPFWVELIGRKDDNLFHLRTNIRYGCVILRHYLNLEKGNLYRALGRYNGSLGHPDYPNRVLGAWRGTFKYPPPRPQRSKRSSPGSSPPRRADRPPAGSGDRRRHSRRRSRTPARHRRRVSGRPPGDSPPAGYRA
ncbi:MAG: transglycosylase SLT domain-containing protein [Burkholderiales bacterium]